MKITSKIGTALLLTCVGASFIESHAGAAPGDLRDLDPKTGLPKTWDSQVGRDPPPSYKPGGRVRAGGSPLRIVKPGVKGTPDVCQHFDRTSCADPTFTTRCPNAAPTCAAAKELDTCLASPPAGKSCAETIRDRHQAEISKLPTVKRIVPSRRSVAGESRMTTFVPFDPTTVKVVGMDHAFATRMAHPAARATATPAMAAAAGKGAPARSQHFTRMHAALQKMPRPGDPNGKVTGPIDSCEEYGARKYLSLTQFDDAVSANQRDPRKTYRLLFESGQFDAIAKHSLTPQIFDSEHAPATYARTAKLNPAGDILVNPEQPLVFAPIQRPRNTFLDLAVGFGRTYLDPTAGGGSLATVQARVPSLGLPDYPTNPPIQKAMEDYQKAREVYFNQELFTRAPFTKNDARQVKEDFDWHKAKNDLLWQDDQGTNPNKFTDEELRVRYDRQKDLSAVLARRYEISNFIRDVSRICRHRAEPPPPPQQNPGALNAIASGLEKAAVQMTGPGKQDAVMASAAYFDIDALLTAGGIGGGWTVYDIGSETMVIKSQPKVWGVTFSPNDGFMSYSMSCHQQTGCPVRPNKVPLDLIASTAIAFRTRAVDAGNFNTNIWPKLKDDQHNAFVQADQADDVKCKGFGIPTRFKAIPGNTDPNAIDILPPTLDAGEAAVVANALRSNVLPKLEAIDAMVYEQLNSGIELGCFARGMNGCDWSPNRLIDFAHDYRHEVDAAREADVQRCARFTAYNPGFTYKDRFKALMLSEGTTDQNTPRNLKGQPGSYWKEARSGVKNFENWMLDAEQETIKQLLAEMEAGAQMQVFDEGNRPGLGQIYATDGGFGSDMFGAEYGAGGGFRFGNLSTDKNRTWIADEGKGGTANNFTYWAGNFAYAGITLLGMHLEVFNARMDIALTNGHVLDFQQGIDPNAPGMKGAKDKQYLADGNYLNGIFAKFKEEQDTKAKGDEKYRIVQGHLHFRVAGDDIFDPVNAAVIPKMYVSTEPIYSFEPASKDETLFDESTTITVVIVPVTIRGWATFHAGVSYRIVASLDRPNIHTSAANKNPFDLHNTIEPYAEIDGNVSVAVGVPGFEIGLKGSLQLIRMGLPYHSDATVSFFESNGPAKAPAGKNPNKNRPNGNRFKAGQGLDFVLSTLSGSVSGFVQVLLWTAEKELFHWDGITSTTPIFSMSAIDADVDGSSAAARLLAKGFAPNP
jgi:hypothetical protein